MLRIQRSESAWVLQATPAHQIAPALPDRDARLRNASWRYQLLTRQARAAVQRIVITR